jgi:hypothetical protein
VVENLRGLRGLRRALLRGESEDLGRLGRGVVLCVFGVLRQLTKGVKHVCFFDDGTEIILL